MSRLADDDDDLHLASDKHRAAPTVGDVGAWQNRLARHLQAHERQRNQGSPWGNGTHVPGQLRTSQAEVGSGQPDTP